MEKPRMRSPEALLQTAHEAFARFPGNCSGSVHYVIQQLVDATAPALLANDLLAWLADPANGWAHVPDHAAASPLANQGQVVVAGAPEVGGHGHVIVVVPGAWIPAGGYEARGVMMPRVGSYPLAMSTALAPAGGTAWPGALTDCTKTVYDPWFRSNPALSAFRGVTFWTKAAT
jgi:hypothetical protein